MFNKLDLRLNSKKLYSVFRDLSRRSIGTGFFGESATRFTFFKFDLRCLFSSRVFLLMKRVSTFTSTDWGLIFYLSIYLFIDLFIYWYYKRCNFMWPSMQRWQSPIYKILSDQWWFCLFFFSNSDVANFLFKMVYVK